MRALATLIIAGLAAALTTALSSAAAEAVKIRASWVVAPSDWTPLLPEKPELMKNNGKTYAFEALRFQGTPSVITALANNEIEFGNLAFSSLALAIQNAGLEDLRIVGDQFKDGTSGHYSNEFLVLADSPIRTVEDLKGRIVATNTAGSAVDVAMRAMLRKHGLEDRRDYTVVEAPFPTMKAMLVQKKADLATFVAPFSFDPELKRIARVLFTQKEALGPTQMIVWVAHPLPAEEPSGDGRLHGGRGARRALVSRPRAPRRGRADRRQAHQAASRAVHGLAVHEQGICAQSRSSSGPRRVALQHRCTARSGIPQGTDRRAQIRRSEYRAGSRGAVEVAQ